MNTETDVDQTWQAWARGDPLEVVDFLVVIWICMLIPDYFFFFLPLRNRAFVSICHTSNSQFVWFLAK